MTEREINNIIDNIALKIGATTDELFPEIIKYMTAEAKSDIFVGLMILLLSIIIAIVLIKLMNNTSTSIYIDGFEILIGIFDGIFGMAGFFIVILGLHRLYIIKSAPIGAIMDFILCNCK